MTIFFDMDGTIANLYGIDNWLNYLLNEDPYPYMQAQPLLNLQVLARTLNKLKIQGYRIEIISWLCKDATYDYDIAVTETKLKWIKTHLHSVQFDKINIVPYGVNKDSFRHSPQDILFDDEKNNRDSWQGVAFDETDILNTLRTLYNQTFLL